MCSVLRRLKEEQGQAGLKVNDQLVAFATRFLIIIIIIIIIIIVIIIIIIYSFIVRFLTC